MTPPNPNHASDPAQNSLSAHPTADTGRRCLRCDYNLTGLTTATCPECGWSINEELVEFARTRADINTQRILTVILALVGIAAVIFGPSIVQTLALPRPGVRPNPITPTTTDSSRVIVTALFFALSLLCGACHAYIALLCVRRRDAWPLRRSALRRACFLTAIAYIAAAGWFVVVTTPNTAGSPVDWLILFAFASVGGGALLLLASFALTTPAEYVKLLGHQHRRVIPAADEHAPFSVDATGRFTPEAVHSERTGEPPPTDPRIDALVAATWNHKTDQARSAGHPLHNGPLARLVGAATDGRRLALSFGTTDYRTFIGTNLFNPQAVDQIGPRFFADPLGTSALVRTADGALLLGRRNDRVMFHRRCLHPFGGMLESSDLDPSGHVDVFAAMRRELREELHLQEAEILELFCTGIVRDHAIHQPEIIFDAFVSLTTAQIRNRFDSTCDEEHLALESCNDAPEVIAPFIESAHPITPVAQAALLLHGRAEWGREWYENHCYVLFGELPTEAEAGPAGEVT